MIKAADAGAFLDLKPYYDKSPQMQKVVSPLAFDLDHGPDRPPRSTGPSR